LLLVAPSGLSAPVRLQGPRRRRRGARTSAFGSPGRVSHDSSAYYGRRLYEGLPRKSRSPAGGTRPSPTSSTRSFCKSDEDLRELPGCSVHLMATSPPHNGWNLDEYRAFLKRVMTEVCRVLVPGGRACINVANPSRRPFPRRSARRWVRMINGVGIIPLMGIGWGGQSGRPRDGA
jgi:site-specific DNA-methyltransferase (adenine-specific)